jgi:hypothetical protein
MVLLAPKQRSSQKSFKSLHACSNMQWCILYRRNCDRNTGEYNGPELALTHEARPIRILSIRPLEDEVVCRQWQVCVEEKLSGERWCVNISPTSLESTPLRELASA